ncbi:MAG TPA: DUF3616 domain-containing protein [Sedimentisphaerales bacterium]|nr:DUF3616 domain-containing protein [Sedimentisphaerales bacterium]HQG49403.1 DUF3616 domain-containing protein [Sedimentisphaerales bacterium]HQI29052.1 DUF3616 domain-containing protein [Sedimentisphaerales bacterium]
MYNRIAIQIIRVLSFLVVVVGGPACGRSESPSPATCGSPGRWTRIEQEGRYAFRGQIAQDQDLSGIAFISDRFGLIGADESRDVQIVEISRKDKILRARETVSLAQSGDEIDIEGIAAEGNHYYIVGSHGISKKRGEIQGNRYSLFRLGVDPATGRPTRPLSLERTSLVEILRTDPVLGEYFGKPLQLRGVNIEGLTVRQGRLFIGFRGPNLEGNAFVLEVDADELFTGRSRPSYVLHTLHLGAGLGIREIVAAKSGFLIIGGNSASEPSERFTQSVDYDDDREFVLIVWDGVGSEVHKVGGIPDVSGKAEAMVILEETQDHMRVLILFDGPRQGRPTLYRLF